MTHEKPCKNCGKLFVGLNKSQRYCFDCKNEWSKPVVRKCEICGKDFYPFKDRQNNKKICDDKHPAVCCICGTIIEDSNKKTNRDQLTCSKECRYKKSVLATQKSYINKYGVNYNPEGMEKARQTMVERYGGATLFESEELREKVEQTNLEKYGSVSPFGNEMVRNKIRKTNLERHGVDHNWKSPEVQEKIKQTMLERYGGHTLKSPELRKKYEETMIERYGVNNPRLFPNSKRNHISSNNIYFHDLLLGEGIESEYEYFLNPYSYDLKLSDKDVVIEVDPTITHNSFMSIYDKDSDGAPTDYHFKKTITASENGLRCIHIFDWDSKDKIIQMLKKKKTLYARKLQLKEVELKETNEFEEQFHLQGKCRGQMIRLGLYLNDQLVQIMTFGKPRYNKNYEWELLRLCTHFDYKIVGGSERLFKKFISQYQPTSIISYCDLAKFTGDVYKRLGMNEVYLTYPRKIWNNHTEQKITDNYLRQLGFDKLFNTNYGKGTSNEQLMLEHGWLPVYDCGQLVYEYNSRKNGD